MFFSLKKPVSPLVPCVLSAAIIKEFIILTSHANYKGIGGICSTPEETNPVDPVDLSTVIGT